MGGQRLSEAKTSHEGQEKFICSSMNGSLVSRLTRTSMEVEPKAVILSLRVVLYQSSMIRRLRAGSSLERISLSTVLSVRCSQPTLSKFDSGPKIATSVLALQLVLSSVQSPSSVRMSVSACRRCART